MVGSVTEGPNFSGTNSGRMNQNIASEQAKLRGKFAEHTGKALSDGTGAAYNAFRYGRPEEEARPYMELGKTPGQAAPVGPETTPLAVAPNNPNGEQHSVNLLQTEGLGP